jgi:cytidyltransferase-like protein
MSDMTKSDAAVEAARGDRSGRRYRVYCDGIFDVFHLGHMKMLEQAKKALGDPIKTELIVGVCSDELTHRLKGPTVMNDTLRYESVRHCKWTDEVVEDAPWEINQDFLDLHRIDFVAHDAIPYVSAGSKDVYGFVKQKGMFLTTQRTEGISTSDIIIKIVKEYDTYVKRNLDRGVSKEEMGVGLTWELRAKAHEREEKFKQSMLYTKKSYQELSDDAKAYIATLKQFTPRRKSAEEQVRPVLPPVSTLRQHSKSFFQAAWDSVLSLVRWLNPFAYVAPRFLAMLIVLVVFLGRQFILQRTSAELHTAALKVDRVTTAAAVKFDNAAARARLTLDDKLRK